MSVFKYVADPKLTKAEVDTMLQLSQAWRYSRVEKVVDASEASAAFCLYTTNQDHAVSRYVYRRDHGKQVIEWFRDNKQFATALRAIHPTTKYRYARFPGDYDYAVEVTTKGDARFSPFFMKLPNGSSLENYYQLDIKGYRQLGCTSWRDVKGKPAINEHIDLTDAYEKLMLDYFKHYPCMLYELAVLGTFAVFTDMHMDESKGNSQAKTYCDILNKMFNL